MVSDAGVGHWKFWYVAPTYGDARDLCWSELKRVLHELYWIVGSPNESRLEVAVMSGATITLKGADRPDLLRGRGLKGVVCDEFATMKPEVWPEILRPSLSDQQGRALFVGTPKSFNHFHALYERGRAADPQWASWQFRTIDGAVEPWGPLTRQEVEDARHDLDERTYRQEYEAS